MRECSQYPFFSVFVAAAAPHPSPTLALLAAPPKVNASASPSPACQHVVPFGFLGRCTLGVTAFLLRCGERGAGTVSVLFVMKPDGADGTPVRPHRLTLRGFTGVAVHSPSHPGLVPLQTDRLLRQLRRKTEAMRVAQVSGD